MLKRTLYFGNPARLSYRNRQLLIRFPTPEGEAPQSVTVPVEDIGWIVLDHPQITLTQPLLAALATHACALLTCNDHHHPFAIHLPFTGHTLYQERVELQLAASLPLRKSLWQQNVQAKILNQAEVLHRNYATEVGNLKSWAKAVQSGDPDNLEGRAAAYYWRSILPEYPNFVRAREEEFPNHLFNYGYAILRAVTARAIVCSGLLPAVGIHHHNRYNAYCLADDLMEAYRPFVDQCVIDLIQRYGRIDQLTSPIKAELLSIPTLYVYMDKQRHPLLTAVGNTITSLVKCFAGEQRKLALPQFPPL